MIKKIKRKVNLKLIIIILIILIALIVFSTYKLIETNSWKNATKVEDIIIKESDSDDVKVEKLQAKIELLNEEINTTEEIYIEALEKMNSLMEEYITEMNNYQSGESLAEDDTY